MKNKSKKIIYVVIAILFIVGIIFFMRSGGEDEAVNPGVAGIEAGTTVVSSDFITILDYDHKKKVFGRWVIDGHVTNSSAYDIDKIEFMVEFSDNNEFVDFDKMIEAGAENVPFTLKLTGHKNEKLISVSVKEVNRSEDY